MDLNTLKSANAATSGFGGPNASGESRLFHVKHPNVPRATEAGSQTRSNQKTANDVSSGRRTKRAPVTFEEVSAAADAILQQGEKVTIERVRQAVGGGGNQAVMSHLARYKELRRKGAQFGAGAPGGLMSEALKAALSQAIDDEIRRQRACAQESVQEQMNELQEACGALEADLKVATHAAFEQEEDLEKMSAALSQAQRAIEAERHQHALAREKILGQVETLQRQNQELQAAAGQAKEAAVEARVKDAAQVSQIAALQAEAKRLREASDGAKEQVAQAEQKAAVAQMQAAGKDELLQVLRAQLDEAQRRGRDMAEEARRSHERARVAEEAQQNLRRKLDVAHTEPRSDAEAATHDRPAAMGLGRAKPPHNQPREEAPQVPKRPPSPPPRGHRNAGAFGDPQTTPEVAPQGRATPATPYERERMIEAAIGPSKPSLMRQLGKPDTKSEREHAKDLLVKAASLRGVHMQRATDMLPSEPNQASGEGYAAPTTPSTQDKS